ncbi:MAG: protein kinase domain-containing protein [Ignavibacteria bacterium]
MKVKLEVKNGPNKGKTFEFSEHDTFLFGRSDLAKCQLTDDDYVSRFHFLLELNPPKVWLKDLGSKNGTYVNDVKFGGREQADPLKVDIENVAKFYEKHNLDTINYQTEIFDNDEIRVGDSSILVTVEKDVQLVNKAIPADDLSADIDIESLNQIVKSGKPNILSVIPNYEIIKLIGEGGMGAVYLAKDINNGYLFAIKIVKPGQSVNPSTLKRFREREMKIAKSLRHKNIAYCYDVDYKKGLYYMIMEYVIGNDIQQLININGMFNIREACEIIIDALEGLSYIHKHNVIHRDIKSSNILVSNNKEVKITDFGLAKDLTVDNSITGGSEYAGTYPYMPPEQIYNFKNCNFSSDLFSMGATLYYMCTKDYPHDYPKGKDAMLVNIQDPIIPIEKRIRNINKSLAKVINKSLSLKMNERYQTAKEMQAALKEALIKN